MCVCVINPYGEHSMLKMARWSHSIHNTFINVNK